MQNNGKVIGIIPCAGRGSRLLPYTSPKEMYVTGFQNRIGRHEDGRSSFITELTFKPAIQETIERMRLVTDKIIIVISSDKFEVLKYLKSGKELGVNIAYIIQDEQKGIGDAIYLTKDFVGKDDICIDGTFQQLGVGYGIRASHRARLLPCLQKTTPGLYG